MALVLPLPPGYHPDGQFLPMEDWSPKIPTSYRCWLNLLIVLFDETTRKKESYSNEMTKELF